MALPPNPPLGRSTGGPLPILRIICDVSASLAHQTALALQQYTPADFRVVIAPPWSPETIPTILRDDPPDVVLLLGGRETARVREAIRQRRWSSKLVVRWYGVVPHGIGGFVERYADADAWVLSNAAYWDAIGRLPRTFTIPGGVDPQVFNVQLPPPLRTAKVLGVGLKPQGWAMDHNGFVRPLRAKLRTLGINSNFLFVESDGAGVRTPAEMAEWYNTGTVLVCASDSEAIASAALEGAACGCTLVSPRMGHMAELITDDANGYLVDREVDAMLNAVELASRNYLRLSQGMLSDIRSWHWAQRSAEWFALLRTVLEEPALAPQLRDLSREVTVFVTTVGAPTAQACLERLRQQDCTFQLQIIDHVAPMNEAFQRMLDECRTPYYVQVDEDMLLHPHAIRTLYERIISAAPNVAIFAADLYDVHLQRCISGIKIFRHEIVRRYPFEASDGFEKAQVTRLAADGYLFHHTAPEREPVAGRTLGLHGTQWTVETIYERYLTLARRRVIYKLDWVSEYPAVFLQRYLDEPSPENFFALQGIIAGVFAARHGEGVAKDYRTYRELPGLGALRRLLEEL